MGSRTSHGDGLWWGRGEQGAPCLARFAVPVSHLPASRPLPYPTGAPQGGGASAGLFLPDRFYVCPFHVPTGILGGGGRSVSDPFHRGENVSLARTGRGSPGVSGWGPALGKLHDIWIPPETVKPGEWSGALETRISVLIRGTRESPLALCPPGVAGARSWPSAPWETPSPEPSRAGAWPWTSGLRNPGHSIYIARKPPRL